jgi:O-antigen/teichoic acid export membrane protein
MAEVATAEARRFGRSAGLLSVGVGSAGLLTYVYFALASHTLDATQYGEIVVLWSVVFITISIFFRPVEQLLSRTVAERQAKGQPVGQALRVAALIQGAVALVLVGIALAARVPLEDDLFGGNEALYWILVVALAAFGASFFARGFVAGSRRFGLYGAILLAESCTRAAFALAVAVGIADGQTAVALGIAAAPLVSLLVVAPLAVGVGVRTGPAPVAPPGTGAAFTLASGSSFAAAVLLIMLGEQTLLNAGPLLVRASVDAAAAGFIFNMLMVARAPLVLFQAVATSLLPHLTRLRARGDATGQQAFALSVQGTIRAIAAFAAIVAAVMVTIGPTLMQLAFGDDFTYDRVGLLIMSVAMGLYLSAATLNQAALAQGQARRAAACYVGCAVGFVAFNLLPILTDYRRVEIGFALAAAVLCTLLYAVYRNPRGRPEDVPEPGSAIELELELAAAEEAS